MPHALVAGGAGFIGSHLCRALLGEGWRVTCLDNLCTGRRDNIAELDGDERFTFIESDVAEAPPLRADLYLHLASPASPLHYRVRSLETMWANALGAERLLRLAEACGGRLVFASTSEVYGDPLEHPQRESYWGNVNPIGPRACYDEAKRFGEALLMEHRRRRGVNATIVRIFNTYGPRMNAEDGRVVPAFIAAALAGRPLPVHGDGSQTRSLCYVSDLVAGLLLVAFDRASDGEVFNLGNPHELTVLDLARAVAAAAGVPCRVEHRLRGADDPERRRPDIGRMRERYRWQPLIPLDDGLRRTIAYFRAAQAVAGARA